jgi:large subunit ribosomal protein L9
MDIILLEHIDKVGAKHEVVKVKDGYGRNYLIPRGLAIVANKANMARLDGMKKQNAKKEAAMVGTYNEWAAKIAGTTFKIAAKAGESGRLFGSVSAQHLLAAVKEQVGLSIEKRIVEMPEEVKELGEYSASIKFHPEVIANAKFEVVAEEA